VKSQSETVTHPLTRAEDGLRCKIISIYTPKSKGKGRHPTGQRTQIKPRIPGEHHTKQNKVPSQHSHGTIAKKDLTSIKSEAGKGLMVPWLEMYRSVFVPTISNWNLPFSSAGIEDEVPREERKKRTHLSRTPV